MSDPVDLPRPGQPTLLNGSSMDVGADETNPNSVRPPGSSRFSFAPPAQPGEVGVLGPYRIVKELGRGGMGAVYLAIDTRLGRKVALKVILPEYAADPRARERFLREARAAAQVAHDNVVTIFEADERDGMLFLAMQFLQGQPLDERLRQSGKLTVREIVRIGRETAAGLAAAHRAGLVHRDIKPSNLWLEAPDGRVKILDFGLVRPVDSAIELTPSCAVIGTPAYMSPEQAGGLKADSRSDLFSLGAVLYRSGAGKLPFEGANNLAVMMALATDEPVPVRELNPEMPRDLAELIHQLLAKQPNDRPQTAEEVVRRLDAIDSGSSLLARRARGEFRLPGGKSGVEVPATAVRVRKRRAMAWVVGAVCALVIATVAVIVFRNADGSRDGTKSVVQLPDPPRPAPRGDDGKPNDDGTSRIARNEGGGKGDGALKAAKDRPAGEPVKVDPPKKASLPPVGEPKSEQSKPSEPPPAGERTPADKAAAPKTPIAGEPKRDEKPIARNDGGAAAAQSGPLAQQARTVFKTYCHRCHHGEGSEGGGFDVLNDNTLTAAAAGEEKPVVVAGKPGESLLWQKAGVKKAMPPKGEALRPNDAELAVIKKWIEAGAPAYPTEEKNRKFIPIESTLLAIRDHLAAADAADRPFLRYFTLAHLFNNPRVPDGDLAIYRAALSKALNSLSWKAKIVLPTPADKEQTVFAIDIRDLDWDREYRWQAISAAYPYSLSFDNHADPRVQKLDDDLRDLAKCRIPYVRADWFIAVATRPPLYYALLDIPHCAADFEKQLKVDVIGDFRRYRLDRAGFVKSGVSEQNRMIERHESIYGAYWKSYDFKKQSDKANLVKLPLGPLFDQHPEPELAFRQDGGEIIFNLPNGLQAYMLVNGKDERIDEGPIEVVSDSLKTSGTNVIVNGLSCMACHKHGMIAPPRDVVRDAAAAFGDARKLVDRLYPDEKRMNELLKEDEDRFLRAADKAAGPFLKVGADKDRPIRDFGEPISEIARLYGLQEIDLAMAACELGIEKPADLKTMIMGNKRLKELGLAPLTREGGVLKRAVWEAGRLSLMQRTARELELGTPNREIE